MLYSPIQRLHLWIIYFGLMLFVRHCLFFTHLSLHFSYWSSNSSSARICFSNHSYRKVLKRIVRVLHRIHIVSVGWSKLVRRRFSNQTCSHLWVVGSGYTAVRCIESVQHLLVPLRTMKWPKFPCPNWMLSVSLSIATFCSFSSQIEVTGFVLDNWRIKAWSWNASFHRGLAYGRTFRRDSLFW